MASTCPECKHKLRVRQANFVKNIRRRQVESVYDKYVCPECKETFSREEVMMRTDTNITMKEWMGDE